MHCAVRISCRGALVLTAPHDMAVPDALAKSKGRTHSHPQLLSRFSSSILPPCRRPPIITSTLDSSEREEIVISHTLPQSLRGEPHHLTPSDATRQVDPRTNDMVLPVEYG